jgi:hypothetical protein
MFIPYAYYVSQAISGSARTFRAQVEEPHRIDVSPLYALRDLRQHSLCDFWIHRLVQTLAISGSARTFRAQVKEPHRLDVSSHALLHYVLYPFGILFPLLH